MEQKRIHPTLMMKRFVEERRAFLIGNRPVCIGVNIKPRPGAVLQGGCDFDPPCRSPVPARLVEQGTPAQWMCSFCKRSWTEEPVPRDEA